MPRKGKNVYNNNEFIMLQSHPGYLYFPAAAVLLLPLLHLLCNPAIHTSTAETDDGCTMELENAFSGPSSTVERHEYALWVDIVTE